jgi:Glycosyltransferase family 87
MAYAQKLALAAAVFVCAGMWVYVDRVLIAHQEAEAKVRGTPRGNLSDLYPSWLAARESVLHHRDPYSPEITVEIQTGYYGRPIDPTRPGDPKNLQAFAYPVYVSFLLAPTVRLPFSEVQAIFRWLLAGLTALSIILWLGVIGLRLTWVPATVVVLFVFGTFPVVQGIKLQQLSLLVAGLIAGSTFLLVKGRLTLAGILLALAMIKPQLTVLLAAWLMLWAFSRLYLRWKFAAAFVLTLAALVGAGEVLLPGWIHEFYVAVLAYRKYAVSLSLLGELTTPALGLLLTIAAFSIMAIICWNARNVRVLDRDFCRTTSLVLGVTVVVIPTIAPYNQPLLIPGALLVGVSWMGEHWSDLLRTNLFIRIFRGVAAVCLAWHWISATVLAAASFFSSRAQEFWRLPLWASILTPVALTVCLGLMICFPAGPPAIASVWSEKRRL